MRTKFLNLEKIINLPKWQLLQDSLARVTNLAIITVDYKGVPVTKHSEPRPFCQKIRNMPEMECFCRKCDSRAGLEAVRLNAPYTYLCHCHIIDVAIPIMIEGQYIGALMAGQIRLRHEEQNVELEKIMVSQKRYSLNDELCNLYEEIPSLPLDRIQAEADMLFCLCNYIIGEAINKNIIIEMYESLGANERHPQASTEMLSEYPASSIDFAKRTINNAINSHITVMEDNIPAYKNSILKPALEYIYNNKGEMVSQSEMAELCHISTSYFSRLFIKETGENFSTFLSKQKIEWSKQLLEKTDLTVTQISEELGFNSSGYFIKSFKRYENITPFTYRKYFTKRNFPDP